MSGHDLLNITPEATQRIISDLRALKEVLVSWVKEQNDYFGGLEELRTRSRKNIAEANRVLASNKGPASGPQ